MTSAIKVKICGLTQPDHMRAAVAAGASYVGLVFFEKSPRNMTIEAARETALIAPEGVAKVALTVNATDAELDAIFATVPIDIWQLQGAETPARVAEVRSRYGLPVMKAVGVAGAEDLPALDTFGTVADMLLVDAKPPKDAKLPGGNGLTFDWHLIAGRQWSRPWMLAGGLTAVNISAAITATGTRQVDVSSGVESAPGVKDQQKMQAFINAAKGTVPCQKT